MKTTTNLRRGISIVETAVAVVLVGIMAVGVTRVVRDQAVRVSDTSHLSIVHTLVKSELERVKAVGPSGYPYSVTTFRTRADGTADTTGAYEVTIRRHVACARGVANYDRIRAQSVATVCGDTAQPFATYIVTAGYLNRTAIGDTVSMRSVFALDDSTTSYSVAQPGVQPAPVVAPIAPPVAPPVAPEPPAQPVVPPAQVVYPLYVSIHGPATLPMQSQGQWLAYPSGGTAPYTYRWSGSGLVVSATRDQQTLDAVTTHIYGVVYLTVTDAEGRVASTSFRTDVTNGLPGGN